MQEPKLPALGKARSSVVREVLRRCPGAQKHALELGTAREVGRGAIGQRAAEIEAYVAMITQLVENSDHA